MRTENDLATSYWPADTTEPLLDITLGGLLRAAAAEVPDRIALVDAVPEKSQRRRWTYTELVAACEQTARALLGVYRPGDRVALAAPNSAEWVLVQIGAAMAGLILVPINPAFRHAEIAVILRNSEASGIFYVPQFRDNDLAGIIAALQAELPAPLRAHSLADFAAFYAGADASIALPDISPEQILQVQFTSGTTGVPKGACLHHKGAINTSRFVAQRAGFPHGGVWLNAMPMFHIAGPVVTEMATFANCGTYVLAPGFEPGLFLELMESERANATLIVPTMIIALLEHKDFATRDHSSMQAIVTGAAMVPEALVLRSKASFGCNLVILFGQTEVNGVMTQTTPDDSPEDQSQTVGRPLPQVEVGVFDIDSNTTVPPGEPGEIRLRGYQTMRGYYGLPAETRAAIMEDGWIRTGDIGTMDRRGYIRITGRLKDMIIRGGMNLYPREIEDVLFDHPEVAEIAVIGVPDEKWGEVVAAVIRPMHPDAPPSPDELHAFCRARLAAHKSPARWYFVERYPLTPSGKVQKFQLQNWIRTGVITPATWSRAGA